MSTVPPIFTSAQLVRRQSPKLIAGRLLHSCLPLHHAQLPLLYELARWRGVLGERQILIFSLPPKKIYQMESKDQRVGGTSTARDESLQAPLHLRKSLFPREPIVFLQAIKNSARKTIAALKNPRVRANALK